MMPTAPKAVTMLEPPELIKGRALPAMGKSPTTTAIFNKASITIQPVRPKAINEPSRSGAFWAILNPRQINTMYSPIRINEPNKPVSSARTAKMLSVWGSGKPVYFVLAFPRPTPKRPPLITDSKDLRMWYEPMVGSWRPFR